MSLEEAQTVELRRALEAVAETAVPRDDCPDAERIWRALGGELPPEDLRTVVDHTAQCAVCAEAWRLGVELNREQALEVRPENGFWRSWFQVAALVAVLAGAGLVFRSVETPAPGPVRSGDAPGISALTPQDRPLPRDELVLRWTAPRPGLRYDVELTWITPDASRVVFRRQDLDRTELKVPPQALAEVPSEAVLLWEVTALDDAEPVDHKTFRARLE